MSLQDLLIEGVKDLPEAALKEVVEFALFVRKRTLQPEAFEEELYAQLLGRELTDLSRHETAHVEEEFKGYDKLYPND